MKKNKGGNATTSGPIQLHEPDNTASRYGSAEL